MNPEMQLALARQAERWRPIARDLLGRLQKGYEAIVHHRDDEIKVELTCTYLDHVGGFEDRFTVATYTRSGRQLGTTSQIFGEVEDVFYEVDNSRGEQK